MHTDFKFQVSSPNYDQKSFWYLNEDNFIGWAILWSFLIYPYKHKYVFNRGLTLLKSAAPELNLGVNTNWVLPKNHGLLHGFRCMFNPKRWHILVSKGKSWKFMWKNIRNLLSIDLKKTYFQESCSWTPKRVYIHIQNITKQALRWGLMSRSVYRAYNAPMSKVVESCQKLW